MAQTLFPKQSFYEIQRLNPQWSDFTCFVEVIKGKKYLRRPTITRWFNELVDKNDYDQAHKSKSEILGFLFGVAKE